LGDYAIDLKTLMGVCAYFLSAAVIKYSLITADSANSLSAKTCLKKMDRGNFIQPNTQKQNHPMTNFFTLSTIFNPKPPLIWAQVRILKETNKALLVESPTKTWIPKSRINKIRLKNNIFEIYVEESVVG